MKVIQIKQNQNARNDRLDIMESNKIYSFFTQKTENNINREEKNPKFIIHQNQLTIKEINSEIFNNIRP